MEKYAILRCEGGKSNIPNNWQNLGFQEAFDLLEEIRNCEVNLIRDAVVTPIIYLHFTTKNLAFAVSENGKHYTYQIMRDYFSEMAEYFKPNLINKN